MNLESTPSRQRGTPLHLLPSIQIALFSLLLACFVLCTAAVPAVAERADFSLLSPQNSLLSLLAESSATSMTTEVLPASWNSAWSNSILSGKATAFSMAFRQAIPQAIPVDIFSTPSTVPSNSNVSTTVTVDQTGSYVQVSCDHPSLLTSPGGSWPYNVNFPSGGSTSQAITIRAGSVSSNTTVKIYACQAGLDINNSANWQAINTITVTP